MKSWKWICLGAVLTFILVGCSDSNKEIISNAEESSAVGFEMANGKIDQAEDVPEAEQQAIFNAFKEYMDAFNAQDVERYIATLSKDPKGFNLDEERKALKSAFETYEIERVAEDVTIVKYTGEEANVYANLKIDSVEKQTGTDLSSLGRQVTVFKKEDGIWKVSSVYYIGSE